MSSPVIQSTTTGDTSPGGGNKVVETVVLRDDATPHNQAGPVCVDSLPTSVDTPDKIVVRGLGLHLSQDVHVSGRRPANRNRSYN